jgi:hypothetical protein
MKNDNCKQIEELLVDFADGELNDTDAATVKQHLEVCADCTDTVKALEESLSMAQVIFNDNLTEHTTKHRRPVSRYIQIAAGLLFVIGLFMASHNKPKDTTVPTGTTQASSLPTMREIELQIEWEGIAARVLARAELIKQNPDRVINPDEHLQNEYRHIVRMYPKTETAKKAAKLIH